MDNTFENGFMCGLLLSIDDSKPHTNVKDPVFRDILENGVPVATINLSSHYKNVLTWYQFTKFPCSYSTDLSQGNLVAIDETQYYLDQSSHYYTDTHYELYYKHWGPMVLFSVIYKEEKPLFATNIYYSKSIYPVYKYHIVMQENYSAADHVIGPNPYEKELVYYKSVDYKFLKDDIEYIGNYRLAAELRSHGTTGGSDTTMNITAFISEDDDKAYSKLQLVCPYEKYQYSSSATGIQTPSRPKITLDSTTVENISYNLSANYAYRIMGNGTYSDFTIDELADVQFNIYYDISCELGKGVINPPKKAILLN